MYMEHILNLGMGEGVFHIHEVEVDDVTLKLFATVSFTSSDITDPADLSEKQSHVAHQCALMKRYMKALAALYQNPDFPNVNLSSSDKASFRSFLDNISSGMFPDIRLTEEGFRMLGAINAKIGSRKVIHLPVTDVEEYKPAIYRKPSNRLSGLIVPRGIYDSMDTYPRKAMVPFQKLSILPHPSQTLEQ
jgi:hypothetical protein